VTVTFGPFHRGVRSVVRDRTDRRALPASRGLTILRCGRVVNPDHARRHAPSRRCAVSDTAAAEFLAFLESKSFDTQCDQQTKTRGALRFFTTGEGLDSPG
jgi:hypothetical protein